MLQREAGFRLYAEFFCGNMNKFSDFPFHSVENAVQ